MSSNELHAEREREAESVRELSEAVGKMITLLRFEAADVYELCGRAFEDLELLDYSDFRQIDSGDFPELWNKACQKLKTDAEALKIFESVGKVIGASDIESQTERLCQIQRELSERGKELKKKSDESKKLYRTIGALSGVAISLMII